MEENGRQKQNSVLLPSNSRQPATRAYYAPLLEQNSQNPNDMDQVYQIGRRVLQADGTSLPKDAQRVQAST